MDVVFVKDLVVLESVVKAAVEVAEEEIVWFLVF